MNDYSNSIMICLKYKSNCKKHRGDTMEYPSKNDFFLSFKALFNEKGQFVDYILVNVSDNFKETVNIKPELLIGRRISEIILENENIIFGIKDFYYHMIPKTRRKFENHIKELDRWYLINIFSDDKDYLTLFYSDITKIKSVTKKL